MLAYNIDALSRSVWGDLRWFDMEYFQRFSTLLHSEDLWETRITVGFLIYGALYWTTRRLNLYTMLRMEFVFRYKNSSHPITSTKPTTWMRIMNSPRGEAREEISFFDTATSD